MDPDRQSSDAVVVRPPEFFTAATVLSIALFIAAGVVHTKVAGHWPHGGTWYITIGLYFLGIVLHEVVHGIAFALVGVPIRAIRLGYDSATRTPYCAALAPVSSTGMVFVLLAPLLIIGIIPFAWAFDPDRDTLAFVSALMIASASGDLLDAFGLFGGTLSRRNLRPPPPGGPRRAPHATVSNASVLRERLARSGSDGSDSGSGRSE